MRFLERLKNNVKKVANKKIFFSIKTKKSKFKKATEKKPLSQTMDVAATIEHSKYYTGPQVAVEKPAEFVWELPTGYGQDKIIVQVRDPWWLHAYWELSTATLDRLREELKDMFFTAKRIIRVYDISYIIFDGTNAHRYFDIEIGQANNWYIDTQAPGRSWVIDLGLKLADGRFIKIARSNVVNTPLDGPSWLTDEEWMIPEDLFMRMYGLGIGVGSSPVGIKKLWQERLKKEFASGALASPGFSPVKKEKKRGFWMVVNTELIVYGATEPDAQVTVQGRPITLRPDGTFSLRFALPDGRQVIPVKAVSSDGLEERSITPIVNKETK